jgi:riboflavin kinase/FMN adenylyltransferase
VDTLRQLGAEDGFGVDVVGPVEVGSHPVSSTQIRRAVTGGDLKTASGLLGRPYSVSGRVVRGAGRGRSLGIPTINLGDVPADKLLPPDGVYSVIVEWRDGRAGGMLNQGTRPTFDDGGRTIETHLFDVDVDLYGAWVRLEWVDRIRDTRRFDSVDGLKAQLAQDQAVARRQLAASVRI